MGAKMIISGNYYQQTAKETYNHEANSVDSLATHMNQAETGSAEQSDQLELSAEAYAALKEHAPEALAAFGYEEENPILDEVKEIAQEKYFHFGSEYLKLPETTEDMINALDVANKYMDALNSIEPDDIYEQVADANKERSGDFIEMANAYSAKVILNG